MILHLLQSQRYDAVAVVLDKGSSKDTVRHQMHVDYKANRSTPPSELLSQFPIMREMLEAFGIPYIEQHGVEADDIIAAYAEHGVQTGYKITVASGDKDLLQLVRNNTVHVYDPIKKKTLDSIGVFEKMGVQPHQIRDYLALIGDASDNIPGVPGIGPKTAAGLLGIYTDLEQIYSNLASINPIRVRSLLDKNRALALLSHQLVTLHIDQVKIDRPIDNLKWLGIEANSNNISTFTRQYGLHALQQKYLRNFGNRGNSTTIGSLINQTSNSTLVENLLESGKNLGRVAIYYQYDIKGQIPHITISDGENTVDLYTDSIPKEIAEGILGNSAIIKVCHGITEIFHVLAPSISAASIANTSSSNPHIPTEAASNGMEQLFILNTKSCHDVSYMAYALGSGRRYDLHTHISQYLPSNTNVDTGKALLMLHTVLEAELKQASLTVDLYNIDHAMMSLLLMMEYRGILVDKEYLHQLGREFTLKLNDISLEIYKEAGSSFNIASPKQVAEVLFGYLKLPGKNKSTSSDVLEELAAQGFTIAEMIQEWRHMAKLQGTYIEGLLAAINPVSKRIHPTFHATSTLTGRLSASEPNLQSVPIKSTDGAKIRRAFIAKDGHELMCADYSQIEIRVLAHIADITSLQQALTNGLDIHTITASQVFGIPITEIDDHWRRRAKAINFGIIYGMSAFGLAKNLGISNSEANMYIKNYFHTYPGIESYMSRTIEQAKENGYVTTILGRKCYITNIDSKNPVLRKIAERSAINAPIQGSAADIMRKAMVMLPPKLQQYLLLQVHDELIFEIPNDRMIDAIEEISDTMRNCMSIKVPLTVKLKHGKSWG